MTVNKRFVMYGNTLYEMKNDNKVELLPTDCFYLLTELYNENEKLKKELEIVWEYLKPFSNLARDYNLTHKQLYEIFYEAIKER